MKKNALIFLLVASSLSGAYAQLTNAIIAIDESNEVKIAKESIDKYMLKEKSLTESKAWHYKGKIYEFVAFSKDANVVALEKQETAIKTSIDSYNKSISLDKPNGEWAKKSKERLEPIWGSVFNMGIEEYKKENYDKSLEFMDICQSIKPADTNAYVVGSQIAVIGKKFDYAKKMYYKLFELDYKQKLFYKNLFYIVYEEQKNTEEAFKVISLARAQFPDDKDFMAQEINLYISTGKKDAAIDKLVNAAKSDPSRAKDYYYNLGIVFKQSNDNVKAKEYFNKSLAIDSLQDGSNYMMGFIILEEGDVLNKKINNMTGKEYSTIGKKSEAQRDNLYKKSIPYFEKSYAAAKDPKVKDQLISLYKKLKMDDKARKLN